MSQEENEWRIVKIFIVKIMDLYNVNSFVLFKILFLFLLALPGKDGNASLQTSFPLEAKGYDSHVELTWHAQPEAEKYRVFRSEEGSEFSQVLSTTTLQAIDFAGHPGDTPKNYSYYLSAINAINLEIASSDTVQVEVAAKTDEQLLDMVQEYTFRYFWDFAHPVSGLVRERNTSGDIVTMGGSGFGIMAILVGIEREFVTREQGLDRLLQIVSFLQIADRFHGVFPHWMDGTNGNVYPFSQFDDGGDLVETAFLMQGLLTARAYFDRDDPYEDALRMAITGLWEDVEWDFYRRNKSNVLYWHWSPNYEWQMNHQIRGYNEALIVYLLAIASPGHPVPVSLWDTGWAGQNYTNGATWYGYKLPLGPPLGGPLFFAHYSYLGFDPRDKKDAYANYFEQNRIHTLINKAYCEANPFDYEGYSDKCWGLTASDDPFGYLAHAPGADTDNGTIAPTAALSSMPFTPEESLAALKHFYRNHGDRLWGEMGFYDAFNLSEDWFADSYIAIDQGPIICMIENYRSGLLWDMFMSNPEIPPALEAIGFEDDITTIENTDAGMYFRVYPNPASAHVTLDLRISARKKCEIELLNINGVVEDIVFKGSGESWYQVDFNTSHLSPGVYILRLVSDGILVTRKIMIK